MISAQTLCVCREGKPVSTFPVHALDFTSFSGVFAVAYERLPCVRQKWAFHNHAIREGPGNELNWFLRRLSWPCGPGRPGFPRSSCEPRRGVRSDRGLVEPQSAQIPKSTWPVECRGGGSPGGAADSLVAAAVRYARSGRRGDGCHSAASRR